MYDYDDIVIGAGSAGAIVATRLSEDGSRKVLLLEAGPDYFGSTLPPALATTHEAVLKGYNWDFKAQLRDTGLLASLKDAASVFGSSSLSSKMAMAKTALQTGLSGNSALTRFNYPLGKLVGGSSAINGALALPPGRQDMDTWVALGNSEWAWDKVLPYLDKVIAPETGAINLQAPDQSQLHPIQQSFSRVCRQLGFAATDLSSSTDTGQGVGIIPRNIANGIRQSTALVYLNQARPRNNFCLMPDTLVSRILMSNGKATAVETITNGGLPKQITAGRIIVCAGAIQSPCILMRSGIGDPASLAKAGISPLIDLPGVGMNLMDHTSLGFWMVPVPNICHVGEDVHQVMLRCSTSGLPNQTDLQLYAVNAMETHHFPELKMALGSDLAMSITLVLSQPESRGRVQLTSAKPNEQPDIFLNAVTAKTDMDKLKYGARLAWQIAHETGFNQHIAKIFAWNQRIINSDSLLEESIMTFARGSWHVAGTAKMGSQNDAFAVVNQQGLVHGCENLYIADASIMPRISANPTNITTMMIAEKISAGLLGTAAGNLLQDEAEEEFVF